MALGRHLVNIDVRNMSRNDVYNAILRPKIVVHHNYSPDTKDREYTRCVFIFEEFDIALLELERRAQLLAKFTSQLSKFQRYSFIEDMAEEDKGNEEENKKPISATNAETTDKAKKPSAPEKSGFSSQDLLELFQGPAPLNGLICFATTNHPEELIRICPALFRPGRLTPVHIDYLDYPSLTELVHYYFPDEKDAWDVPPFAGTTGIPTTSIIDLAMEAKRQTSPLAHFRAKFLEMTTLGK